jgi:hypothetical protein
MEIDGDNVLCPYCKAVCGDWESFNSEGYETETKSFECESCGKKFEGRRVVTIDYRTEKDCKLNGEKHEAGQYHCKKCDVYNCDCEDEK